MLRLTVIPSLYRRQRGVNLGSFFTLEKWLTPSLFDGVSGHSEHDLCRTLDAHQAKERLEKHWNSFVDQGDWKVCNEETLMGRTDYCSSG